MTKTISFNDLRRIKDSLPDGSMHKIADQLNCTVQTVRNYFGGSNYEFGQNCGVHIEPGPTEVSWCLTTLQSTTWPLPFLKSNRPLRMLKSWTYQHI